MDCRVLYICMGFGAGDPLWVSEIKQEAGRPMPDDIVIFCADDVARSQADIVKIWRWVGSKMLDYEVLIEVPQPESDDEIGYEAWLRHRGFRPIEKHEFAEVFGLPELAERFPNPAPSA